MLSFLKKFKNYIQTPRGVFAVLFFVLSFARLVYILFPQLMLWDASVYIGMGRYIATLGASGLWEYFRPPLLPLIFSLGEILGVGIILWAKIITFLASIISLFLVYKISEKIRVGSGIWSMFILGISTLFFSFTNIPMTEVIGVFLSLLTIYIYVTRKDFIILGIVVGLCFLLRFPYGLLLPIYGSIIIIDQYINKNTWHRIIISFLKYFMGFVIVVSPYLILNEVLYGGMFKPFIAGNEIINNFLWLYDHSLWFYLRILFIDNPLFLFSITVFFYIKGKDVSSKIKIFVGLLVFWIVLFTGYFTFEIHKESRYIIPVFPALAILSGMGIFYIKNKLNYYFFYTLLGLLVIATIYKVPFYIAPKEEVTTTREFYEFLSGNENPVVISPSPIVAVYTKAKVIPAYNSWNDFYVIYKKERLNAGFVLIDSCQLHVCSPGDEEGCDKKRKETLDEIKQKEFVVYDKTVNSCNFIIAKINKD